MPNLTDLVRFLAETRDQRALTTEPEKSVGLLTKATEFIDHCRDEVSLEIPRPGDASRMRSHPQESRQSRVMNSPVLRRFRSDSAGKTDRRGSGDFTSGRDFSEAESELTPCGRAMSIGLVALYDTLIEQAKRKGIQKPEVLFDLLSSLANGMHLQFKDPLQKLLTIDSGMFLDLKLQMRTLEKTGVPQFKGLRENFETLEKDKLEAVIGNILKEIISEDIEVEDVVDLLAWMKGAPDDKTDQAVVVAQAQRAAVVAQARKDWKALQSDRRFKVPSRPKDEVILPALEECPEYLSGEAIDDHALFWLQRYEIHRQAEFNPSRRALCLGRVIAYEELVALASNHGVDKKYFEALAQALANPPQQDSALEVRLWNAKTTKIRSAFQRVFFPEGVVVEAQQDIDALICWVHSPHNLQVAQAHSDLAQMRAKGLLAAASDSSIVMPAVQGEAGLLEALDAGSVEWLQSFAMHKPAYVETVGARRQALQSLPIRDPNVQARAQVPTKRHAGVGNRVCPNVEATKEVKVGGSHTKAQFL